MHEPKFNKQMLYLVANLLYLIMKRNKHKTDFLLPSVSFLTGMGSIFNISGNYYSFNTSKSGFEADCKALRSDWQMIGQDIQKAIEELEQ